MSLVWILADFGFLACHDPNMISACRFNVMIYCVVLKEVLQIHYLTIKHSRECAEGSQIRESKGNQY